MVSKVYALAWSQDPCSIEWPGVRRPFFAGEEKWLFAHPQKSGDAHCNCIMDYRAPCSIIYAWLYLTLRKRTHSPENFNAKFNACANSRFSPRQAIVMRWIHHLVNITGEYACTCVYMCLMFVLFLQRKGENLKVPQLYRMCWCFWLRVTLSLHWSLMTAHHPSTLI